MRNTSSSLTTEHFAMRSDLHLLRKAWHTMSGLLALTIYFKSGASAKSTAEVVLLIASVAFFLEWLRLRVDWINSVVMKLMGPFMRESERKRMSGFAWYGLGAGLSLYFFSPTIAVLSILFLIFSDPISSLFGVLYGTKKIFPNKSLEGSLAGFFTCFVITIMYASFYGYEGSDLILFAVLAGFIGSLSEMLSQKGLDDNLTIPLFSGMGLSFLNQLLSVF